MLNQLIDMRRLGFNGSERTEDVPTVAVTFQNACIVFRPAYLYGRESSFGYIVPKHGSFHVNNFNFHILVFFLFFENRGLTVLAGLIWK